MNKIKVFLVDDNNPFRQSTAWLLEEEAMEVDEFHCGEDLLIELEKTPMLIDNCCVVTDLRMPGMSGLELMDELCKRRSRLPVIMMTGHGDVAMAVEVMQRGATNFIEKPFSDEVLIETIKIAVTGPGAGLRNYQATSEKIAKLSPREKQVLNLVSAGKLNKTIADILGISIKTVELHRSNMLSKLGVRNVQDLVRLTLGYL